MAWLGPTLGIFGSTIFSVVLLSSFAADSAGTARVFNELAVRMAAAGHPLDASAGPVITEFPDLACRDTADPDPRPPERTAG